LSLYIAETLTRDINSKYSYTDTVRQLSVCTSDNWYIPARSLYLLTPDLSVLHSGNAWRLTVIL